MTTASPQPAREDRVRIRKLALIDAARAWTTSEIKQSPGGVSRLIDKLADALEASAASAPPTITDAEARIAAALAEMDRGTYGDPEVPFRMRAALGGEA